MSAMVFTTLFSGCNILPKQNAGDTAKQAIQNFEKSQSFNFHIEQRSRIQPITEKKAEAKKVEDSAISADDELKKKNQLALEEDCEAILDAAIDDESFEEAEKMYLACVESQVTAEQSMIDEFKSPLEKLGASDEKIKKIMTPERIEAINKYWFEPTVSTIDGVVDKKSKKLQLIYTINYKPKNFALSMTLPMLLDFDEMSITLDPAIALPILAPIVADAVDSDWENKAIKFTLPKELAEQVPTDLVLSSLSKALVKNHMNLPNDSYQDVPFNTLSNKFHSSRVISHKMDAQQQLAFFDGFIKNWVEAIDTEVQKDPKSFENMKEFNGMLQMAKELTKKGLLASLLNDGKMDAETKDFMLGFIGVSDRQLFLDGNKINAIKSVGTSELFKHILNAELVRTNVTTFKNFNNAQFTFNPSDAQIINGNELPKKIDEYFSNLDEQEAEEYEEDMNEEEMSDSDTECGYAEVDDAEAASAVAEGAATATAEVAGAVAETGCSSF